MSSMINLTQISVDVDIIFRTMILDVKDLRDTMVSADYVRRQPDHYDNLGMFTDNEFFLTAGHC